MRKTFLFLMCLFLASLISMNGAALAAGKKKAAPKKSGASQAPVSKDVARVNGVAIARSELDRAMKVMLRQAGGVGALPNDKKKEAELAVLNELVSMELLNQAARKIEVKDIGKKVESQVSGAKSKFPSPAKFDEFLAENNMTENDFKSLAEKEIYINNLIETRIASKVTVTDAEMKKFYDDNPEKFKIPESVRASHILIGTDGKATDEDKTKAREKANALLKRVKAGEDFAALAKENSTCPSGAQGGDLGAFTKGQMVPAFETAAFALKPGEISEVVETRFGFHIIKVMEKQPAKTVTYDEAKQKIQEFLKSQKIRKDINDYVDKLRKEGKVEILIS